MKEIINELNKPLYWFSSIFLALVVNFIYDQIKGDTSNILQRVNNGTNFWDIITFNNGILYLIKLIWIAELFWILIALFFPNTDAPLKIGSFVATIVATLFFFFVGDQDGQIENIPTENNRKLAEFKNSKCSIVLGIIHFILIGIATLVPIYFFLLLFSKWDLSERFINYLLYCLIIILFALTIISITIKNAYRLIRYLVT